MNKKVRKAVKLILITLILIMLLLINYSMADDSVYKNMDMNVIYGAKYKYADDNSIVGEPVSFNLTDVYNSNDKRVRVYQGTRIKNLFSILEQPNVYCVQKGEKDVGGYYSVGYEYTVLDPLLRYIFLNGPAMGTLEADHNETPAQNALWKYLNGSQDFGAKHGNDQTDKEIILGGDINCSKPENSARRQFI